MYRTGEDWGKDGLWAPLKTVLFCDGGVSRVLKSSCIRPYTPVFRAGLPCPHQNAWFVEVPLCFQIHEGRYSTEGST